MTRHGDICACGHARHFHALKLVAGGYRNDQCWAQSCYCIAFETLTGVARIPVYFGGEVAAFALVDDADAEKIGAHKWRLQAAGNSYALRDVWTRTDTGRTCQRIYMHREVAALTHGDGLLADHVNRNRLDNRRSNLRIVDHQANAENTSSVAGSSSRFRGVHAHPSGRWRARLTVDRKSIHVGYFDDEIAAARAVEAARREHMPYAEPDPALGEFEPEPSQLRDAAGSIATASIAGKPAIARRVAASGPVAACESSPSAHPLMARAGTSSSNENAGSATHIASPHGPHGGSPGERCEA